MQIQDNFLQYAMKAYRNPSLTTIEEFNLDLNRIKCILRLLVKDELNVHLLLNHFVVLLNVFEPKYCVVMLFYKLEQKHWSAIKTFLVYLNYMPEQIEELNIISSDIALDQFLVDELRKI